MKRLSRVLLAVGLSLLFVNVMWGQFTIQVIAADGANTDTLVLGTAVGATSGIDAGQGEVELPPVPPGGIFDARFAAFTGVALGQGTAKDVRGFVSTKQNGTYKIKWQASTENTHGDSMVFSWASGLGSVAGGYWHLTTASGRDIDMAASTSAVIGSDDNTITITTGDKSAFTTFTYQRFQSDLNAKGKQAGQKPDKKAAFLPPNVHNVGEEITGAKIAPLFTAGSSATQSVLVNKYGDLLKDFSVKGATHSPDSITCLDSFPHTPKGKVIAKQLKSISPVAGKGINSYLFAQLATLKFNLKASGLKTPAGLGALVINDGGKFNGRTINSLALAGDSALSCLSVGGATAKEVTDMLEKANKAFNMSAYLGDPGDTHACDTLPGQIWWHGVAIVKGKPAVVTGAKLSLQLAGWLPLAKVSWLSAGASAAPVNERNAVVENVQPAQYSLDQNYPNPFNPTTKIQFNLVDGGMVAVKIFNMLGQEVATLANQEMSAGAQSVTFDASSLASGVYFYRVTVNDLATGKMMFTDMKKMMLVK